MVVDDLLIAGWIKARSLSRGLPEPVPDHGGWRVESGLPTEVRRYVFANPVEGIRAVAEKASEPFVVLKLCRSPDVLRALLPARWRMEPVSFVMRLMEEMPPAPDAPPEYRMTRSVAGDVTSIQFLTSDNDIAASGFAAEAAGVFIYDRIVVAEAHLRRGLGRSMMLALSAAKRDPRSRSVLVATPAGRALYETLGWSYVADYATAVIG